MKIKKAWKEVEMVQNIFGVNLKWYQKFILLLCVRRPSSRAVIVSESIEKIFNNKTITLSNGSTITPIATTGETVRGERSKHISFYCEVYDTMLPIGDRICKPDDEIHCMKCAKSMRGDRIDE